MTVPAGAADLAAAELEAYGVVGRKVTRGGVACERCARRVQPRSRLLGVLDAARPALGAGLVTVALAALVGAATGLVAGYRAGTFDALMMRVWDTLLAFPAIFLAIGIVTVLGPGWINAVLAIAILNMPVFSRLVRASTLAMAPL